MDDGNRIGGVGMRTCDICGKELQSGYVINDGEEYYCENCLSKKYTKEEYNEMYENDEAYWTEWYDD